MLLLYVEDRAVPGSAEAKAATGALVAYHDELEAQGVLVASDPLAPPGARPPCASGTAGW